MERSLASGPSGGKWEREGEGEGEGEWPRHARALACEIGASPISLLRLIDVAVHRVDEQLAWRQLRHARRVR